MRRSLSIGIVAFACTFAACGNGGSARDEGVKVAFIADLSVPDALEHVLPARQGAELAFRIARVSDPSGPAVELVPLDVGTDPDAVDEIDSDPAFVAAIVAPGAATAPIPSAEAFPIVSLSGSGAPPAVGAAWLRLVAPVSVVADALVGVAPTSDVCVLSDEPGADELGRLVAERAGVAPDTIEPSAARGSVESSGCSSVTWVGSPSGGAEAATTLGGAGVAFAGGDRLLGPDFLGGAGRVADGAMSICSCADVSTSLELDARRFVQEYQARFGSAPGAYAVEGWDAAKLLLRIFGDGSATRATVHASLEGATVVPGLHVSYRFGPDGELLDPTSSVQTYQAQGGRWRAVGA